MYLSKIVLGSWQNVFFPEKPNTKYLTEKYVTNTVYCCNPLHQLVTNISGNYSHTST